jgi:hypothetical protein
MPLNILHSISNSLRIESFSNAYRNDIPYPKEMIGAASHYKIKIRVYFKMKIQAALSNPEGYYSHNKNTSLSLMLGHLGT